MSCSSVRKVIPRRAGDDDMEKPQSRHCLCNATGLSCIDRQRLFLPHIAECTEPGAGSSQDQKRRLFLPEAFGDVRAERLLADSVQFKIPQQPLHFAMSAGGDTFLKPFGFSCDFIDYHAEISGRHFQIKFHSICEISDDSNVFLKNISRVGIYCRYR
jgi:hypothetical protein